MLARLWNPSTLLVGMKTGVATMESSMNLKKLKLDLPFDPAIPLLGIYLKEPKTLIHKDISAPMFTAALFTIAKIWKQSKCPSVNEWIKQLWDIYTMEFYWAIKKKEREGFTFFNSMDGPREHYAQ